MRRRFATMSLPSPPDVTRLLLDWRAGDDDALASLLPLVYDELRRIARGQMRGERADHTLQPTALVHEAYARLAGAKLDVDNRAHFFAIAARVMRQVLVDHARARRRAKRGGDGVHVPLDEEVAAAPALLATPFDALDLDRALTKLAVQDAKIASVVELHFFGGLTYPEIGVALEMSEATVHRHLRFGRAWLRRELAGPSDTGG